MSSFNVAMDREIEQMRKAIRHYQPLREAFLRLAVDDPIAHSYEGLDDGCFWCGGRQVGTLWLHEAECAWLEARFLLGLEQPDHAQEAR